jgi:hypothetical protein
VLLDSRWGGRRRRYHRGARLRVLRGLIFGRRRFDLQVDLSGFAVASSAKAIRLVEGSRQVKVQLADVTQEVFKTLEVEVEKPGKITTGCALVMGTGLLFVNPIFGLASFGFGYLAFRGNAKEEKQLIARYSQDLSDLALSWPDKATVRSRPSSFQ